MRITKTIAMAFGGLPVLDVRDGQIVDVVYGHKLGEMVVVEPIVPYLYNWKGIFDVALLYVYGYRVCIVILEGQILKSFTLLMRFHGKKFCRLKLDLRVYSDGESMTLRTNYGNYTEMAVFMEDLIMNKGLLDRKLVEDLQGVPGKKSKGTKTK